VEIGTVGIGDPSEPYTVESALTGVGRLSVPVVNPVKGEEVGPLMIGLPSESVRTVTEDRGSIPETAKEVIALDRPDPRGWVAFTSPEAPAIGTPVASNSPAVTIIVTGTPSGPVDIVVLPNGAVGMILDAAAFVMGEPLASYEVDAIVPVAKVPFELIIDEGSAEESAAIVVFPGPSDGAAAVVWPISLITPDVDDELELPATPDAIGRPSGPKEGPATVV
jgi:hypothetical protein